MSQEARDLFWIRDYEKVVKILIPLEKTVTELDIRRLVYSLIALKQYEEAEAVVNRHPNNRELDDLHVALLKQTGRPKEAESVRQKALDYALKRLKHAQPGIEKASRLSDVGSLQANLKEMVEFLKLFLEELPDHLMVQYEMACSLRSQGKIDEALKYARMSVATKPEFTEALSLVKQLEEAKEIDKAEKKISQVHSKFLHILKGENVTLRSEVATLRTEIATLKIDNARLKIDNARLRKS